MTGRQGRTGRDQLTVVPDSTPASEVTAPPAPGAPASAGSAVALTRTAMSRPGQGRALRREGASMGLALQPRLKTAGRPVIDLDELWAPMRPERRIEDREFLPGALEILEAPASPIRIALIYAVCGLIASVLVWSWFGHLDVYADATGKVQASGRTKVVQPIDSGKVVAIKAGDGDAVKAGDVLIQLDPTEAIADRNVTRDNLFNARAEAQRHQAEVDAVSDEHVDTRPTVSWPQDVPVVIKDREEQALRSELSSLAATIANLVAERVAKQAQIDKYQGNIGPQQGVIDLINEHLGMRNQLFKDGWNSRATVLEQQQQLQTAQLQLVNLQGSLAEAKAAVPVIDSQIALSRQTFVTNNIKASVAALQQVDQLTQDLAKASDKVDHMTLVAPISGTVQATAVTTIGQVVTTGQQLMQIVPVDTPLEIEAYILNSDAGFIKVGQDVTIKVDTFPYTRYGTISGKVEKIASDALPGKQAATQQKDGSAPTSADGAMSVTSAAQQTSDLVFPVIIKPSATSLKVGGRLLPLTSGMTVTVEVQTESRRAIDYILAPLQSLFEQAAQER